MLIRDAEVDGQSGLDVQLEHGIVKAIGKGLDLRANESVIEARGGALIPGLHDHHIHLFALAAAQSSVDCGPAQVRDAGALKTALEGSAAPRGWIRGVGYHESVAGELDRTVLDRWVPELCLRIQHRSGQAWFLNSPAIEYLGLDEGLGPKGIERDSDGRATGRLFRADDWLAEQLPSSRPRLDEVGRALASYGVIGVTDATPTNGAKELEVFGSAVDSGALRQRLFVMGTHALPVSLHPDVTSAAVKLILDERALPGIDQVAADIARAHDNGRTVAFHCVARSELVLALGALQEAGARPGDRIEHAGVTPPDSLTTIAELGLTVVTQPGFIRERGDDYLRDVEAGDQPWLYRCKSFDEGGVAVGGSTDAPYSDADPWLAIQAAVDRRSRAGQVLAANECVTPERALALFTTVAQTPGAEPRTIAVGQAADLCLLDSPWAAVAQSLSSDHVLATWLDGSLTWQRGRDDT